MPNDIPTAQTQDAANIRLRRHVVCSALWVAALANVLVPAALFSATRFFGPSDFRYRVLVAVVVATEYLIAFLLILLHANEAFAAGYTAATAATATVISALLTYITLGPARWSWSALSGETLVLAGFAFAVLSNFVFLLASIRYGRAIHPRLHIGGFVLGILAFVVVAGIYVHFFR